MRFVSSFAPGRMFQSVLTVVMLLSPGAAWAQAPARPNDKSVPRSTRPMIPVVKVTPRPISDDSPVLPGLRGRVGPAPGALSREDRSRLLRDSGVDFKTPSAPAEFKLSPRDPYVSSAAYLVFSGNVQFSSASNQIFLNLPDTSSPYRLPQPEWPEWLTGPREAGPQPDPPGLIAVRIRSDGPGRYLVDFSVSAETSVTFKLKTTGADGTGNFPKSAGGHHVAFLMDVTGSGYAQIDCWADRPFTFHNVVVTKLD